MKKAILLAAIMLMSFTGLVQAQAACGDLGVTLDITYASRYIWRGLDLYGSNHSAIQPSMTIDWYGTGLGTTVWMSRANGSGFENSEEFDYSIFYSGNLFADEAYATNYTVGWVYYDYPDNASKTSDAQEVYMALSWPKICPMGIVPSYTVVKMWPAKSDSTDKAKYTGSGFVHVLGLGYDVTGVIPNMPDQAVHLSAATVYNDGVGGAGVDHDWSHAVFGAATTFPIAENLKFTPAVYYQSSWDDTVNTSDEYWTSLSLTYTF